MQRHAVSRDAVIEHGLQHHVLVIVIVYPPCTLLQLWPSSEGSFVLQKEALQKEAGFE